MSTQQDFLVEGRHFPREQLDFARTFAKHLASDYGRAVRVDLPHPDGTLAFEICYPEQRLQLKN